MYNHTYNQTQSDPAALSIKNIAIVMGVCVVLLADLSSSTASFYTNLTSSPENSFSAGVWDAAVPPEVGAPAVVLSQETSFTFTSDSDGADPGTEASSSGQTDQPPAPPVVDDTNVEPVVLPVVTVGDATITITDTPPADMPTDGQ